MNSPYDHHEVMNFGVFDENVFTADAEVQPLIFSPT